ncbi:NusB antitermination factor [Carboxydocella sporoproducens DSM 16521]|uniref:16S rRNA (cytosine(967)-C(5))-methyltransferase n=2 Tax=Carboxydocella TaxID=178898 RepID=A0A1T4MVH4_9FIRM|nr:MULTISPECIES: 16S rRNA (cytosine(967)-C(5))-methyltransferase RsmB [Carboxydocella]AVX20320.1 NusB antitermination factor [Carboxydocella thermautotrophica]AVX30744.1 NusB antitermination factor [Carboxydocella thermautotrophica]SJZ70648.1 NusB antitermination factor [Carboxydocella sporoproducens DSM 16521]
MKEPRQIAVEIVEQVLWQQAYSNLTLNKAASALDSRERKLVTELVYGTVKYYLALAWLLNQFLSKPLEKMPHRLQAILLVGAYQIVKSERIPGPAAVHTSVELAKKNKFTGLAGLVNGVLRNLLRNQGNWSWPDRNQDLVGYLSVFYSYPRWLVQLWLKELGEEDTEKLLAAGNNIPPLTLRTNTLRLTRAELVERLQAAGTGVKELSWPPEGVELTDFDLLTRIPGFAEGWWLVQDQASMQVAHVVAPLPGMKVLDTCAAPGGKTTHLAQLMSDQGEIVACDIHPHKLKLIEDNCLRLGIKSIHTVLQDATALPSAWHNRFDRVLVDAPCSGLGVIRRRPEIRWQKAAADLKSLPELQKRILQAAAACVAPGGILVYSTCTINRQENQEVARWFGENFPEFQLLPWEGAPAGEIQLLPHRENSDGFFLARWRKEDK